MNDETRPSWLDEPCPPWCTRQHSEDDHPEDRRHQDDGASFAAVAGRVDPATMTTTGTPVDIVVQRYQEIGAAESWLIIREAESEEGGLLLAWGSVAVLRDAV